MQEIHRSIPTSMKSVEQDRKPFWTGAAEQKHNEKYLKNTLCLLMFQEAGSDNRGNTLDSSSRASMVQYK